MCIRMEKCILLLGQVVVDRRLGEIFAQEQETIVGAELIILGAPYGERCFAVGVKPNKALDRFCGPQSANSLALY